MVIDAQIHAWASESAEYPWDETYVQRLTPDVVRRFRDSAVEADEVIRLMDDVGVDRALLTSPGIYGADYRYAFAAARRHAGRFAVVGPVGPNTRDVESVAAAMKEDPVGAGIRLIVFSREQALTSGAYDLIFRAALSNDLPLFLTAWGMLASVAKVAKTYPDLRIVLDHLGLMAEEAGPIRLRRVPDLLRLSEFDNIVVKCSAAPSLSQERFPFLDLGAPIRQIVDAFGPERVMWGSGYTLHRDELSYRQALDFVARLNVLDENEQKAVVGGSLATLVGWGAS